MNLSNLEELVPETESIVKTSSGTETAMDVSMSETLAPETDSIGKTDSETETAIEFDIFDQIKVSEVNQVNVT
jgi:hypothetical protein